MTKKSKIGDFWHFEGEYFTFRRREGEEPSQTMVLRAGRRGKKRSPVDGRWMTEWARKVEIYASPTGRSIRIFVDGKEV